MTINIPTRSWNSATRHGFSLIELIVSVAIVAILIGLSLPAIQKVRTSANITTSKNNLHQMALAAQNYASDKGFLPPSSGWDNPLGNAVQNGAMGSFFFQLLPYTENAHIFQTSFCPYNWSTGIVNATTMDQLQSALAEYPPGYAAIDWNQVNSYDSYGGMDFLLSIGYVPIGLGPPAYRGYQISSVSVKSYISPTDPTVATRYSVSGSPSALTSYLTNRELLKLRVPLTQITDGTSNTMILAEGYSLGSCTEGLRYGDWTQNYLEWIPNPDFHYYPGPPIQYIPESSIQDDYLPGNRFTEMEFFRIPSPSVPSVAVGPYVYDVVAGWIPKTLQNPTFQDSPALIDPQGPAGDCSIFLPQSLVPGGINVAMADGSVRNVSASVSYSAWSAAITPNGNEVIDDTFSE